MSVDGYFAAVAPDLRPLARAVRGTVQTAAPELVETIKWAHPTYSANGPCVYIKAFARHLNVGFWRGAQLTDPHGLILAGGSKMGHVKLLAGSTPPTDELFEFVREAVALNRRLGDPTKGR